jgi:hypothetical protein
MQAHGDVARLARGIDPVAHLHARERHAQRLRRVAHGDAEVVREPAVELDLELVLRLLLERPTSTAPGIFFIFSMKSP